MLKYAKIVDEETKQCDVGIGDPDAPFSEKVIPAVEHKGVIPAEYDEEGNLIKEEQIVTIVDVEEHTEIITIGDYYKYIGMEEMDVEKAYNGNWYVEGYAPEQPAPTKEEQSKKREQAYALEVDPITCHIQRLGDEEQTPEIEQEIADLKVERSEKVEEIKERYPYPVEE